MLNGGGKQLLGLPAVFGLAQRPHQLGHNRLGGHVAGLQHAGQFFGQAAHLVNTKVTALVLHLGGKHRNAPAGGPVGNGLQHGAILAVGQPAHAKTFHHHSTEHGLQKAEYLGPNARHQPQHKHTGVQTGVKLHRRQVGRPGHKGDQAGIAENGRFRVIDAGKGIEAFAAHLAGTGAQNHLVVKHDLHAPRPRGTGVGKGPQQVVAGVGIPVVNGFLAAGKHNGLGWILYQIAEGRGGVGHGVGAVGDHKAVVAVVVLPHGLHHLDPVLRPHIGGIQVEQKQRFNTAKLGQFGHKVQQFAGGDGRRKAALLVWAAGNGAACGQKKDLFHIRSPRFDFVPC